MNILFYTPLNGRCRDIESQALEFQKTGHEIFLLTQSQLGQLHNSFRELGFRSVHRQKQTKYIYLNILWQLSSLIVFIYRNHINVVYAHLEPANFIAVLAQFFVPARVIICRHHSDYATLTGIDRLVSYKITYRWAKDIIVVSKKAKDYMIVNENVPESKIHIVPLSYNFDLYEDSSLQKFSIQRTHNNFSFLLLYVGRFDSLKRPEVAVKLLYQLRKQGLNTGLIMLGNGIEKERVRDLITTLELDRSVFLKGHVDNVLQYMRLADMLIHPSISESSCISIKEAGITELPVIVCKGVGDFDEVIKHNENGFLVSKDGFVEESASIINSIITEFGLRNRIGKQLKITVLREFDIRRTASIYEQKFHLKLL